MAFNCALKFMLYTLIVLLWPEDKNMELLRFALDNLKYVCILVLPAGSELG